MLEKASSELIDRLAGVVQHQAPSNADEIRLAGIMSVIGPPRV